MTVAQRPAVVATYTYHDAAGNPSYETLRYEPKTFRARQVDGHGGHSWSLERVERIPYRLPRLLTKKSGGTTFFCEGEKDADALIQLGLLATTNAGGAAWKLTTGFTENFRGAKRIVVLADCDEPGRQAARERAQRFADVCADVRILDLDPSRSDGYDVSDWIAEGHTRNELRALVDAAHPVVLGATHESGIEGRLVRLVSAAHITPVETRFAVAPYIPKGEATWFEGTTKSGKTMAAVDIAARVTRGIPFATGEPIELGRVAILSCEDDPARTLVPRLIAATADLSRVNIVSVLEKGEERVPSFLIDLPELEREFRKAEVSLVLIDGTFGMLGARDGNSYTEAYATMVPFIAMIRSLDVACIIVRHTRKSDASALHKGIGSVGFGALARSTVAITVDKDDETGARRFLSHAGSNVGETGPTLAFTIEGTALPGFERTVGRIRWGEVVETTADEAVGSRPSEDRADRSVAEDFLESVLTGPMPAAEVYALADRARIARRTLNRTAKRLGVVIERRGFGGGSIWTPPPFVPHSGHSGQTFSDGANGANDGLWGTPAATAEVVEL